MNIPVFFEAKTTILESIGIFSYTTLTLTLTHDLDTVLSMDMPKQPRISMRVLKDKYWAVYDTMEPYVGPILRLT